jgi:uncharacterized protein YcnI
MSIFRPGRLLTLSMLTAIGLTVGAGIASAHVTVNPNTAVAGSYTKLTFRVPNESAKASTVKVTVNFPMDHPFASVSVKKEPGWVAKVTTSKLTTPVSDDDHATITQAVSSITWTADASGKIALGEFAEFDVSVGPVPKVPSVAFQAIQSYDDGSVVKWDEPTPASGVEPEHPAPVLTISAAENNDAQAATAGATATTASTTAPAATLAATPVTGTSDNTARILGVVGIIVGAVALLVAAIALRGRPKVKP